MTSGDGGSELTASTMLQAYGKDRFRAAGDRVVLLSAIPKGWTARTPAAGTHAEYPGTAVEWDGRMFEVVEAGAAGDGVRYVLLPWRDDHVIRQLERYDEAAEQHRIEDFETARRQRRASLTARVSGMLLGHLPASVQTRLQNELGVSPASMTILSCIPPLLFLGVCVVENVGAFIDGKAPRIPGAVTLFAAALVVESGVRFQTAMSQNRGVGSLLGLIVYAVYAALPRNRASIASRRVRGESTTFTIPPPEAVAEADRVALLGPLFTLLPVTDQEMLAHRTGYDYRKDAAPLAAGILFFAVIGAVSMFGAAGDRITGMISFLLAVALAVEQILRLLRLRSAPAASLFGFLVRPFLRGFLDEARRTKPPLDDRASRHATSTASGSGTSGTGR